MGIDPARYGPWALIVGGSEGIGAAFARDLAAAGLKLVLVARKPEPLAELQAELEAAGAEVRVVSADLSRPDALEQVRAVTDGLDVGLLVYNAGANNTRGDFTELDPAVYRSVIGVNVIALTEFVHHYGAPMRARGAGGMILVGSLTGFLGAPSLAAYGGAKAFARVFAEAVWGECQPHGVHVLHLVVGFTATPLMARLGYDLANAQAPEEVAREGLANIANGPMWIMGGPASMNLAIERSRVPDRAGVIRALATPRR